MVPCQFLYTITSMQSIQTDNLLHIGEDESDTDIVIQRLWIGVKRVWNREREIRDGRYDAQHLEREAQVVMNTIEEYGDSGQHTRLAAYLNETRVRTWLTNYHLTDLNNLDITRACCILCRADRQLSFSMGHHKRLGANSIVFSLEPEVLRMITQQM